MRPADEKRVDARQEQQIEYVVHRGTLACGGDYWLRSENDIRVCAVRRDTGQNFAPHGGFDTRMRRKIPNNCVALTPRSGGRVSPTRSFAVYAAQDDAP